MSVFGDVGIAAAERLERSLGPTVGLRGYRKLLDHEDPRVRAAAALAAVRCARAIGDDAAIDAVAQSWRGLKAAHEGMVAVVLSLVEERHDRWAITLAEAEAARRDDGRGHYLLARVHHAAGRASEALLAFDDAAREGDDPRLATTAVVYRLAHGEQRAGAAAALARAANASAGSRSQRAWLAEAWLAAPSQFVRAKGLSLLEELVRVHDEVGRWAMARVVRHADTAGPRLTWVEADRIAAALSHHPDEVARERAEAALSALRRLSSESTGEQARRSLIQSWPDGDSYLELVEALQCGLDVYPETMNLGPGHPLHLATQALSTIAALRRGDGRAASRHLRAFDGMDSGWLPAPVWTAWQWAMTEGDAELRAAALRQLRQALSTAAAPPPRGYLSLVPALRRAGDPAEVLEVVRRAAARGETDARAHLVRELTSLGWRAHAEGEPRRAATWLREAKLLT